MPELAIPLGTITLQAAARLAAAGVPEPRRQALRIWAELNQVEPAAALLGSRVDVGAASAAQYQQAIERRAAGEPIQHVTGWSGFRHLWLRCDRRALIPRPETEGLVDLLLQRTRSGRVVDVGTGSGCIALSLALEGGFSDVIAIDCSVDALALANENRRLTGARADLIRGDLCASLRSGQFDALISNPPYLTTAEYAGLDPSVRWEPALALQSGGDGLDATLRLLDQGRDVLRPGGWLALEVDSTRAGTAAHRASALGWEDVGIHVDLFGRERYLLARRSNTR